MPYESILASFQRYTVPESFQMVGIKDITILINLWNRVKNFIEFSPESNTFIKAATFHHITVVPEAKAYSFFRRRSKSDSIAISRVTIDLIKRLIFGSNCFDICGQVWAS